MLISIRHETRYEYAVPVSYAVQSLRLTPAAFDGQKIVEWTVTTSVPGAPLRFKDGFGNLMHLYAFNTLHQDLTIGASGLVETADRHGVVSGLGRSSPPRIYLRETPQTRANEAIQDLAAGVSAGDPLERLHDLLAEVRKRVAYVPGVTDAHTGAAEALADGRGVCQDHAHVFIAAARTHGVPARYVTGYLVLNDAATSDAHHAWAEAWVEGLGWVGFDVANGICPTDRYVRLACGLDARSAAPVIGSRRGGGSERMDVAVNVQQQSAQQQ
jgi:transglutaminase-like putative cysteine protease